VISVFAFENLVAKISKIYKFHLRQIRRGEHKRSSTSRSTRYASFPQYTLTPDKTQPTPTTLVFLVFVARTCGQVRKPPYLLFEKVGLQKRKMNDLLVNKKVA
jgi:hypothetical protein